MRLCAKMIQMTVMFPTTDTRTIQQYAMAHRTICHTGWTNWFENTSVSLTGEPPVPLPLEFCEVMYRGSMINKYSEVKAFQQRSEKVFVGLILGWKKSIQTSKWNVSVFRACCKLNNERVLGAPHQTRTCGSRVRAASNQAWHRALHLSSRAPVNTRVLHTAYHCLTFRRVLRTKTTSVRVIWKLKTTQVHIYLDTDPIFIILAIYATRTELLNWSADFKL